MTDVVAETVAPFAGAVIETVGGVVSGGGGGGGGDELPLTAPAVAEFTALISAPTSFPSVPAFLYGLPAAR